MFDEANENDSVMVFEHRNNLDTRRSAEDLTESGMAVLDFTGDEGMDATDASENSKGAATRSFETLRELSRVGGIGVVHTKEMETVAIGRVSPASVAFPKLEKSNGEMQTYKGFMLDDFDVVDDVGVFEDVYTSIGNRGHLETLTRMPHHGSEDAPKREAVLEAFTKLDIDGRLN